MVLVIHTAKQKAQAICDIFYYMGVISYPANAVEGLTEISDMYRAVLIIDPEKLPDINGYLEKLRSYNTHIPIFAISDSPNGKESEAFDGYFPNDIYSSKLVEEIGECITICFLSLLFLKYIGTDDVVAFSRLMQMRSNESRIIFSGAAPFKNTAIDLKLTGTE